ncbi:MAG: universal stress protein [Terriglobales bacterium]
MLIQRILCPIDFSEFSTRAFRHALSLAEHYQASLVALHVVEMWKYPYADYAAVDGGDYANLRESLCKGGKQHLQDFVNQHRHEGIHPELAICEGRASDSILSFAQTEKFDLIVMGTHGRRGFDRLMLGSATDRVMREASCPVLAVCQPPHDAVAAGESERYVHYLKRILTCTDFSENSDRALDYAISVAEEYGAELTVMHVIEEIPGQAEKEAVLAAAQQRLERLIPTEKRTALRTKTLVRLGKPYQRIVEHARGAEIDLVTMGVRGAGALDRAIFGSTTYRVIQLGPCPVLAVHV